MVPLTLAARRGAICYLDEVVEARQDVVVVIHPLTDHRRLLPIEKRGELVEAAAGFQLVVSYNPGYQHALKDLKPSTRQRFVTIEFGFPPPAVEQEVVAREGRVERWRLRHAGGVGRPDPAAARQRAAGVAQHPPAGSHRPADWPRHPPARSV